MPWCSMLRNKIKTVNPLILANKGKAERLGSKIFKIVNFLNEELDENTVAVDIDDTSLIIEQIKPQEIKNSRQDFSGNFNSRFYLN